MAPGVRTLLERLGVLGIRLQRLRLARGFYSVRVIGDLITAEVPFIRPAVKRAKKSVTPGGPTGTDALAAAKQGRWTSYTLKSPQEGRVDFALAVVCHNTRGQRGRPPSSLELDASHLSGTVWHRVGRPASASSAPPHQ